MSGLAGDHVRVLVDGYQLTGNSNRITIDDKRQMHDATAFEDVIHKFITGRRQISLEHGGYFDPATAASHPVLKDTAISGVVSVFLGLNSTPVEGNPAYSLSVLQGHYKTMPEINKVVPFTAHFANRGQAGGWGTILAAPQNSTFSVGTTGTTVDNGAQTTKGGVAFLHILDLSSANTYQIDIEDAASSGGPWTAIATFSLNGTALGSERLALPSTIRQYTRWRSHRTSGSSGDGITIAVSLVRF